MDRAHKSPRGKSNGESGGNRLSTTRTTLAVQKPANDNRLGLKGWIERVLALALLIGLAALLAWKVAG